MAVRKASFKVDVSELTRYRRGVARRAKNLRPVWDKVFEDLADAHVRNFQTDGAPVGGWAPLTRRYFNEKFRQGYGRNTLERTGDLKRALSQFRGPGSVRAQRPTSAVWGIDVSPESPIHYAKFHQMGTRNMHERQIVYAPRKVGDNFAKMAGDHVISDKGGRSLRGLFD